MEKERYCRDTEDLRDYCEKVYIQKLSSPEEMDK